MLLIPIGESRPVLRQIVFALIAVVPPIAIAFATRSVKLLVGITGSYAGLGIMFFIPAFLVFYSRKAIERLSRDLGIRLENPYKSPFHHMIWVLIVLIIASAALIWVTYQHIYDAVHHIS